MAILSRWLADILQLTQGFELHRREGGKGWKIFTVLHKMPRYLYLYYKISFIQVVTFWRTPPPRACHWGRGEVRTEWPRSMTALTSLRTRQPSPSLTLVSTTLRIRRKACSVDLKVLNQQYYWIVKNSVFLCVKVK